MQKKIVRFPRGQVCGQVSQVSPYVGQDCVATDSVRKIQCTKPIFAGFSMTFFYKRWGYVLDFYFS